MRESGVVVTRLHSWVGGWGGVQFWTATRAPAVGVVVDVIDLNEIARWPMGFFGAVLLFSFFGGEATQIFCSNSQLSQKTMTAGT